MVDANVARAGVNVSSTWRRPRP